LFALSVVVAVVDMEEEVVVVATAEEDEGTMEEEVDTKVAVEDIAPALLVVEEEEDTKIAGLAMMRIAESVASATMTVREEAIVRRGGVMIGGTGKTFPGHQGIWTDATTPGISHAIPGTTAVQTMFPVSLYSILQAFSIRASFPKFPA